MHIAVTPPLMLLVAPLVPSTVPPARALRFTTPVMATTPDRDKLLQVGRLPAELVQQRHQYFDRVEIVVQGGNGGNGAVIRLPRDGSGPRLDKTDGGELILPPGGGNGGDIVLFVDPAMPDLLHLHRRPRLTAERGADSPGLKHLEANTRLQRAALIAEAGEDGAASGASFWDGANLRIPVPAGTFVRTAGGRVLGDLVSPGQELCVASGGRGGPCVLDENSRARGGRTGRGSGGLGRRRRRRGGFDDGDVDEVRLTDSELFEVTRGQPAEKAVTLQLLLRTVADVGFVGLPNAGKSTLLRGLTRAKAEVAPYPFTTLMPNLGAMQTSQAAGSGTDRALSAPSSPSAPTRQTVLADLPGLVEGAHQGRGLGRQFLQQLRRVRLVLYVLDATNAESSPAEQYAVLLRELKLYNPQYLNRPHLIALNKLDLVLERDGQEALDETRKRLRDEVLDVARSTSDVKLPVAVLPISGLKGKGLAALQEAISRTLETCSPA